MKRWNELARSSIEQAGCIIVLLVFVIISYLVILMKAGLMKMDRLLIFMILSQAIILLRWISEGWTLKGRRFASKRLIPILGFMHRMS